MKKNLIMNVLNNMIGKYDVTPEEKDCLTWTILKINKVKEAREK